MTSKKERLITAGQANFTNMKNINKILEKLLVVLMIIMTFDVLWGVFTRYVMGNQASWSEELARYLLIWIGLLGAAYASGKKMHLSIDLLEGKIEQKNRRRLQILIASLVFLFALFVMVIGGGRLIYIVGKLGQHSPALNIPMQLVYLVVPLSGVLIMVYKWREMFLMKE